MTTQADAAPALPAAGLPAGLPADWLLDVDLACPSCRYNLRKLHAPRCPECGNGFRWQTLLHISCPRCDASLETEDGGTCASCGLELDWARLLGERDPAELTQYEYTLRPGRAAIATLFAALFPRLLWRRVRLEWPPAQSRLRRLRNVLAGVYTLGVAALYLVVSLTIVRSWIHPAILEQAVAWLIPAIPPLVTAVLMPVFTPTLSRFRIRLDQLRRIFSYGAIGLGWLGLLYIATAAASATAPVLAPLLPPVVAARIPIPLFPDLLVGLDWLTFETRWGTSAVALQMSALLVVVIAGVGFVWWWRFVFVALRDYLRLKRGDVWALFLSTQFIALLTCFVLILRIGGDGWTRYFGRLLVP